MNSKILVPAAALALLAGGTAKAQNTVPPAPNMFGQSTVFPGAANSFPTNSGSNPGFNNGFNGFNPGFNNGFNNGFNGFNNGFNNGFDPRFSNGFNPGFNNGFNGTGFNNGFNPFTGNFDPTLGGTGFAGNPSGFYGGSPYGGYGYGGYPYGGGYGGAYQSPMPDPSSLSPGPALAAQNRAGRSPMVPVIGVNTVAPPPPGRPELSGRTKVNTTPKTPEDFAARRLIPDQDTVASHQGAADQTQTADGTVVTDTNAGRATSGTEVRRTPATPDQARLAAYAQQIMANRPMREGLVVALNGSTVDVSYQCNGESRQDTFPAGEVFFFRPSGALTTASLTKSLRISDRVLVACEGEHPRQAVAGMRQETRGSDARKSPAAAGSASGSHAHGK